MRMQTVQDSVTRVPGSAGSAQAGAAAGFFEIAPIPGPQRGGTGKPSSPESGGIGVPRGTNDQFQAVLGALLGVTEEVEQGTNALGAEGGGARAGGQDRFGGLRDVSDGIQTGSSEGNEAGSAAVGGAGSGKDDGLDREIGLAMLAAWSSFPMAAPGARGTGDDPDQTGVPAAVAASSGEAAAMENGHQTAVGAPGVKAAGQPSGAPVLQQASSSGLTLDPKREVKPFAEPVSVPGNLAVSRTAAQIVGPRSRVEATRSELAFRAAVVGERGRSAAPAAPPPRSPLPTGTVRVISGGAYDTCGTATGFSVSASSAGGALNAGSAVDGGVAGANLAAGVNVAVGVNVSVGVNIGVAAVIVGSAFPETRLWRDMVLGGSSVPSDPTAAGARQDTAAAVRPAEVISVRLDNGGDGGILGGDQADPEAPLKATLTGESARQADFQVLRTAETAPPEARNMSRGNADGRPSPAAVGTPTGGLEGAPASTAEVVPSSIPADGNVTPGDTPPAQPTAVPPRPGQGLETASSPQRGDRVGMKVSAQAEGTVDAASGLFLTGQEAAGPGGPNSSGVDMADRFNGVNRAPVSVMTINLGPEASAGSTSAAVPGSSKGSAQKAEVTAGLPASGPSSTGSAPARTAVPEIAPPGVRESAREGGLGDQGSSNGGGGAAGDHRRETGNGGDTSGSGMSSDVDSRNWMRPTEPAPRQREADFGAFSVSPRAVATGDGTSFQPPRTPRRVPESFSRVDVRFLPEELGQAIQQAVYEPGRDASAFRVQLIPEQLGQVHVRVSLEQGQVVNAQFLVENQAAKQALEASFVQLSNTLGSLGLAVGGFSVALGFGGSRGDRFSGLDGDAAAATRRGVRSAKGGAAVRSVRDGASGLNRRVDVYAATLAGGDTGGFDVWV